MLGCKRPKLGTSITTDLTVRHLSPPVPPPHVALTILDIPTEVFQHDNFRYINTLPDIMAFQLVNRSFYNIANQAIIDMNLYRLADGDIICQHLVHICEKDDEASDGGVIIDRSRGNAMCCIGR